MNWTIYPLQNIDTLNQHDGFYVCVFVVLMCIIIINFLVPSKKEKDEYYLDEKKTLRRIQLALIGVAIFGGLVSFNTGTIVNYRNVEGKAKFVGFTDKNFSEKETYSKYQVDEDTTIMIPVTPGQNIRQYIKVYGN